MPVLVIHMILSNVHCIWFSFSFQCIFTSLCWFWIHLLCYADHYTLGHIWYLFDKIWIYGTLCHLVAFNHFMPAGLRHGLNRHEYCVAAGYQAISSEDCRGIFSNGGEKHNFFELIDWDTFSGICPSWKKRPGFLSQKLKEGVFLNLLTQYLTLFQLDLYTHYDIQRLA